ncbi:hypothetical protein MTER_18400 [Mycolicibacter terrae]|uniref:Uncharacterized protein n=1 Tax=Mycolicibacter terrae TaxID=1788 RepID=A0AAD1HX50_9MYCO|nr:hypothetical protein MTER_18400 [Mycolicibacter terrae]
MPSTNGPGGHPVSNGVTTCSKVIGKVRMIASCVAQATAASDSGDPSTPTTIPVVVPICDIVRPSNQRDRPAGPPAGSSLEVTAGSNFRQGSLDLNR